MDSRESLHPIKHQDVYDLYILQKKASWGEAPVLNAIRNDANHIFSLTPDQLEILKIPVVNFSVIDSQITKIIDTCYIGYFNEPEYQLAFGIQKFAEGIHQICYAEFLKHYFPEGTTNTTIFDKTNWIKKYMAQDPYLYLTKEEKQKLGVKSKSLKKRLAIELFMSSLLEGADIPSNFAIVYWFKDSELLPGFTTLNEYIEVEEYLHFKLNVLLYNKLTYKISEKKAHKIVNEWLSIIKKQNQIVETLQLPGISFNALLNQSIFLANDVLKKTGYKPLEEEGKEIPYMHLRNTAIRSTKNFETVATNYSRPADYKISDLDLVF